ncbi:MerR family transcriptional regulator [Plantactinospora sp. GCM10030261]|uniref:MerR family transcriptional regulator n=1 Tax=Plantactinospora sp. GCM10030261 TaxID=3273420 RepID=UPI00360CB53E
MRIGELARSTGVSVRALRHYEEKGVLKPTRTPSGYRVFREADVRAVQHVQVLLAAGLNLDLIREILTCMKGEKLLLADCRERLARERRRMTVDIDRISAARSVLDSLLSPPTADVPPGADSASVTGARSDYHAGSLSR